jgi:hypothetical protein
MDGLPLPHGPASPAHHWGAGSAEHHAHDAEAHGGDRCEHPEANCDCLWVDLGGEG